MMNKNYDCSDPTRITCITPGWKIMECLLWIADADLPKQSERGNWFPVISMIVIHKGISLLYLKNQTNAPNMMRPDTPVTIRTHWNAFGTWKNEISKFMPKIPATTPKMATTKVAVVSNSSNWISWFRTLSCTTKKWAMQSIQTAYKVK